MKKTLMGLFCLFTFGFVFSLTEFSLNDADAQTWRTRPDPFGGGFTTRGPSGTYRTKPNPFGGGSTTRGPSGTYRTRPNPFGGGWNTRR